jgi:pimeloyl-ACP methyl ester carboxylesterase
MLLAISLIQFLFLAESLSAAQECQSGAGPLRFRITLSRDIAPRGASGRLFVFMSTAEEKQEMLRTDFVPGATGLAAMEIEYLAPGESITFDPDVKAYPQPFSRLKPGRYQFMAHLDPDHSLPYTGPNEGDLWGPVVFFEYINPACTREVFLALNRRIGPGRQLRENSSIKLVEFTSPLLTEFWGRPITMRAGIVLPKDFDADPKQHYPAAYHVHGFGVDHGEAWVEGPSLISAIAEGKRMKMIHVFLEGSFPTGHHEFADSVNNGPWGQALTSEFIPWLEKRYRLIDKPYARFLTGHSSGGWSTLWLQVTYPDYFGGTWSTAPDPVDFRSFTGIDVTPGSNENAYRSADGRQRYLVRFNGKDAVTLEDFARQEEVQGEYGGQFASFEWVFSPKGADGRPMRLFNRQTGEQDPVVQRAWQKYNIRLLLEQKWESLGPRLKGKIHIICGSLDTFHLNESLGMLCDFLRARNSDATCEIVPGRDHFNLYQSYKTYPDGLDARIDREMQQVFDTSKAYLSVNPKP